MKTYSPFAIAFLTGFVLSECFGGHGAWALFSIVSFTVSGAFAWCYLEAQNDATATSAAEPNAELSALLDMGAMWKSE